MNRILSRDYTNQSHMSKTCTALATSGFLVVRTLIVMCDASRDGDFMIDIGLTLSKIRVRLYCIDKRTPKRKFENVGDPP